MKIVNRFVILLAQGGIVFAGGCSGGGFNNVYPYNFHYTLAIIKNIKRK